MLFFTYCFEDRRSKTLEWLSYTWVKVSFLDEHHRNFGRATKLIELTSDVGSAYQMLHGKDQRYV